MFIAFDEHDFTLVVVNNLSFQGLSGLDREPLVIGISVSLPEALQQYTKGPFPEKIDEVLVCLLALMMRIPPLDMR